MTENKYNPEGKEIRFIDSGYQELFRIPDGGYITITREDGEQMTRKCRHHGECHVDIGTNLFHLCEFAERMERVGSSYAPCPEPEIVQGYRITDKSFVGDKVFVLAHNPDAVQPWVTWQGQRDTPGYDCGHYWSDRSTASTDYLRRTDAALTGRAYDYTRLQKPRTRTHDHGAR